MKPAKHQGEQLKYAIREYAHDEWKAESCIVIRKSTGFDGHLVEFDGGQRARVKGIYSSREAAERAAYER